jgi:two-component system LytT family response regulator
MLSREPIRLGGPDRRLSGPAVIVGAWTLVALAAAVQAVALVRLEGRDDMVGTIIARLSIIPIWALATPPILRSARRFPVVDGARRVSVLFLGLHLALASLFVVLANVMIRLPLVFTPPSSGGGLDALARSTIEGVAEFYPAAVVVYGVIVAIGHFVFQARAADARTADARTADAPAVPPPSSPVSPPVSPLEATLAVRQWNRVHLVRVEDIDFVEAEDNYVVVHAASRTYKGRDRISDLEAQLDARRFVRIHRSTIVHLAKIREVQPLTNGDHAVVLRDGKVLRVARSRRQALGKALGLSL